MIDVLKNIRVIRESRLSESWKSYARPQLAGSLSRHGTCWLVDIVQPMVAWIVLILGWFSPHLAVGTWGHLGPVFVLISPASLCSW